MIDGRHPAPEPADRGDERLDERRAGIGLHRREHLHDLEVLPAAAVGWQERGPPDVDRHPDGTVLLERLVGDRGGRAHGGFDRRFIAAAGLDAPLQVEHDPGVGGLLQVELLDLDLPVAGGALPVDAVHAVARGIGPNGRRQRGGLQRPDRRDLAALERGRGQPPARQRLETRVDHHRDALPDGRRGLEEAERVTGPDVQGLDPEVAAPRQRDPDQPGPFAATGQRDRPARQPAGERRRVVDLEPELGDPARVAQRVGDPQLVADMAVELADGVPGFEVGQAQAHEHVRPADDEDGEIEQVEEERQRSRKRRDHEDRDGDDQLEFSDHRVPRVAGC